MNRTERIQLQDLDVLARLVDALDAAQDALYDHIGPWYEQFKEIGEFVSCQEPMAAVYKLRTKIQTEIERRASRKVVA